MCTECCDGMVLPVDTGPTGLPHAARVEGGCSDVYIGYRVCWYMEESMRVSLCGGFVCVCHCALCAGSG